MYVTRPLSMYKRSPESLSLPTSEGPNSGYLVLHDEESDEAMCFGCCEDPEVKGLPFPQNKDLTIRYSENNHDDVAFIPVLDKPLSANTYYVIRREGRHRWQVYTNSKEEDMADCCCGKAVQDVKPKPLDPSDIFQQIVIVPKKRRAYFTAKAVASDGIPPSDLRREWTVDMVTPHRYQLGEAPGLNASKRSGLPGFDFPVSKDGSESMVVGKWHCPFLFIKEGGLELKQQMKQCMFYEMRLEQRWERFFDKYNEGNSTNANSVFVDAFVKTEAVFIAGSEAFSDNLDRVNVVDGFMWFKSSDGVGGERSVGLSMKILERMKWEQERVGWVGGEKRKVRVERTEKFGGTSSWNRFGCYVLVERFVLKRMDGSLALLTYDFKHTHQIRSKWE